MTARHVTAILATLSIALSTAGCEPSTQRTERLLLAVSKARNQLLILDRADGSELAAVATGVGPHQVAVHAAAARAVVTNYGSRENPGSSLTVVDLKSKTASATIDLGRHRRPHGVVFLRDPDRVLVTATTSRSLLIVNVAAGKIESVIPLRQRGAHQIVIDSAETRAWVANLESGSVSAVDLLEEEALGRIFLGEVVEGLALSTDGKRLFAAHPGEDRVSVIDTASLEVVETIECPGFPVRLLLTADGESLLVSNARSSELVRFSVESGRELDRIPMELKPEKPGGEESRFELRPVPVEMALSPDLPRVYVATTNVDLVAVVDLEKLEVVGWFSGVGEPEGIVAVNIEVEND